MPLRYVVLVLAVVLAGLSPVAAQEPSECFGRAPTIVGTPDDDHLTGTNGDDVIDGGDGDDVIDGLGGNDRICGGHEEPDRDTRGDELLGGDGADRVDGGAGYDRLDGGGGADRLRDPDGFDVLTGGGGDDTLNGGNDPDQLMGGRGNDLIKGGVRGGDGDDDMVLFPSAVRGIDVDLAAGVARGEGTDELRDVEHATGGPYDDELSGTDQFNVLFGDAGDDRIEALGGNDVVSGEAGDDAIDGGDGRDSIWFIEAPRAIEVDLAAGTARGWGRDEVVRIDAVRGTTDDDRIFGDGGRNELDGGRGRDLLAGRGGRDRVYGDRGPDVLRGGRRDDEVVDDYGSDRFFGGAGDDTLSDSFHDGAHGKDAMDGGGGRDTCINGETDKRCERRLSSAPARRGKD